MHSRKSLQRARLQVLHTDILLTLVNDCLNFSNTLQDIEERILRRREMVHLFQWYYPEGGWGYVVLACACLSQAVGLGFQLGFGFPLARTIAKRFSNGEWGEVTDLQLGKNIVFIYVLFEVPEVSIHKSQALES